MELYNDEKELIIKEKERKEKNNIYMREYYQLNLEQKKLYDKEHRKTEAGKKSQRISRWRNRGVINDDFNSLYEYYINCKNCEECNVELIEGNFGSNKKCLDHNHETGLFRNVVCCACNTKRGILDKIVCLSVV